MAKKFVTSTVKAEFPQILQKWRWAEIPPFEANAVNALVQEVMALRERVHTLESHLLGAQIGLRFGGGPGGPTELPAAPAISRKGPFGKRPVKVAELPH